VLQVSPPHTVFSVTITLTAMIDSHNGFYPYPLFGALSTAQRVGLFAFSGALMAGSGRALGGLYGVVNGTGG
jgi:hypothetical protein